MTPPQIAMTPAKRAGEVVVWRGWRVQVLTKTHMDTHIHGRKDPTSAGYHQNPISVYYCYNLQGALEICIAEVTNTPWGERVRFLFKVRGWWVWQGGDAVMYDARHA